MLQKRYTRSFIRCTFLMKTKESRWMDSLCTVWRITMETGNVSYILEGKKNHPILTDPMLKWANWKMGTLLPNKLNRSSNVKYQKIPLVPDRTSTLLHNYFLYSYAAYAATYCQDWSSLSTTWFFFFFGFFIFQRFPSHEDGNAAAASRGGLRWIFAVCASETSAQLWRVFWQHRSETSAWFQSGRHSYMKAASPLC